MSLNKFKKKKEFTLREKTIKNKTIFCFYVLKELIKQSKKFPKLSLVYWGLLKKLFFKFSKLKLMFVS